MNIEQLMHATFVRAAILRCRNDTGCFTTEQFEQAFHTELGNTFRVSVKHTSKLDLRRTQLRNCGLVTEVEPDIWKENDNG